MGQAYQIVFGPFRLDLAKKRLWHGKQEIALQPRPVAVLHYLIEHSGRIVPKEELLKQVWMGTCVTKTALKVCIRAIRKALGEDAVAPRYIETVGQVGYRFIDSETKSQSSVISKRAQEIDNWQLADPIVGRNQEVEQLQGWLRHVRRGVRHVVFVTGEAGIGKTTVVDVFLDNVRARGQLRISRGQCLEQYGGGEAYLPVLEAFGRLCREAGGRQVAAVLAQYAPTWFVQMPALVSETEWDILQRKVAGATRERMLREMAEAVEALAAEQGLVLVFEDLQWSDPSTLELIAYLARRREPAQLMVIGTYRPTDVVVREHPLRGIKQELQVHGHGQEIRLELLTDEDVAEYVARRFGVEAMHESLLQDLAGLIYRRTDGNALFMVNLLNDLMARHMLVQCERHWELTDTITHLERQIPLSVRQFIEQRLERLSVKEREVLEAGSVAGGEFSAAAVAAGIRAEVVEVEKCCADLAQRQHFIRSSGINAWPDGTVASGYSFLHALYREVLYGQVTEAWRVQLHRRIGEREETGFGAQTGEIAAELAIHFELGRDYSRAVRYRQLAGENAMRRSAYQETIGHLTKGLELLMLQPDTLERTQQELRLQLALGAPLTATEGFRSPEVTKVYARTQELYYQAEKTPELLPVLSGLLRFHLMRAELQMAHDLGKQLLDVAQSAQDSSLLLEAHRGLGVTLFYLGEGAPALAHLAQGIARYDLHQHRSHAFSYVIDPGVFCLTYAALTLWLLGYPDQALEKSHKALALAQELSHPYSLAFTLSYGATLHQLRRARPFVQERAQACITLSAEHGFPFYSMYGAILQGWSLAEQGQEEEGIAFIRKGLHSYEATGAALKPYFLILLAHAYEKVRKIEEELTVLTEALAMTEATGERWCEAEVYRLKGELALVQSSVQTNQKAERARQKSPIRNP